MRTFPKLTSICSNELIENLFKIQVENLTEADHVVEYINDYIPNNLQNAFHSSMASKWNKSETKKWSLLRRYALLRCLSSYYKVPDEKSSLGNRLNFIRSFDVLRLMKENDDKNFHNIQSLCL